MRYVVEDESVEIKLSWHWYSLLRINWQLNKSVNFRGVSFLSDTAEELGELWAL